MMIKYFNRIVYDTKNFPLDIFNKWFIFIVLLQTMYREGRGNMTTVKVNLYSGLSREAALSVGYQHNVLLHERKKPVAFLDKVRLMRHLRPAEEMDRQQVKDWKDSLLVVFRANVCI